MKSVGRKIFVFSVAMVCLFMLILGTGASYMSYQSTLGTVRADMTELAEISAKYVEWELRAYLNVVEDLGQSAVLSSSTASQADKLAVIQECMEKNGFVNGSYATLSGDCPDGNNYAERPYFKNALAGKSTITSPTVSKLTGELVMIFAAPILSNGEVTGVVFLVPDSDFLNDIMRNINASANSESYALDSSGKTIAAVDASFVVNSQTAEELQAEKGGYEDLVACHSEMRAGKSGFYDYQMLGSRYFTGYAPIEGTDGWSLAVRAPSGDFMSETNRGILINIGFVVAAGIICGLLSARMGTKIGKSVRLCTERIQKLAEGDVHSPVPEIVSQDETGALAQATETVVHSLTAIIGDIGRILGAMANKNFDIHEEKSRHLYIGDYADILKYIQNIDRQLNDTLSQIDMAADQVSVGADQVSAAAQSLAQGATEQSSSMEELAAAIHTISNQVSDNARNCGQAKQAVHETATLLTSADGQMQDLAHAMDTINETSHQISGIIKAIEDIAFQTNILALNAAVEAARAGEAGKGFSVVADEVRSLASKAGEAAQDTTILIEKAVQAVTNGVRITDGTAKSVSGVHQLAVQVEDLIDKVAAASQNQASMIGQITAGMDQVSSVVQTNSATAQESAAASEELSGQSGLLKEQVSQFNLRKRQ